MLEKAHLEPGDEVVLQSGEEFEGHIGLKATEEGTPEHAIVIRSSGKLPATILAGTSAGISASTGGIEIRNLILKGTSTEKVAEHSGISFMAKETDGRKHRHIRIEKVEVSGFAGAGITFGSGDKSRPGFEDIVISHAKVHHNLDSGITSWDDGGNRAKGYAHKNFHLVDCDASNNDGGSGIVIAGVENGLVEYCTSYDNHGKGGGVGIWAWCSKSVKFQNCIAARTRTNGGDGGGFDLDGGCVNCVVDHCLSYDCDATGYMHCDYPGASPTHGNAIRYSVSLDDGRKEGAAAGFGFCTWGSGLDDCTVEHCWAISTLPAPPKPGGGVFWVSYLVGSQEKTDVLHVHGCVVRDCVASVSPAAAAFVSTDQPNPTLADLHFIGNGYFATGGAKPDFVEGDKGNKHFATLDEWRAATGQETKDGHSTARTDDPGTPVVGDRITDPRQLKQFFARFKF
jgi:hypothetical protein